MTAKEALATATSSRQKTINATKSKAVGEAYTAIEKAAREGKFKVTINLNFQEVYSDDLPKIHEYLCSLLREDGFKVTLNMPSAVISWEE